MASFRRTIVALAAVAVAALGATSAHALTTWTVTNLNDSGAGSLRAAMTSASADTGDSIVFAGGLTGTITLESSLPTIGTTMTITGPGANLVAISGADITTAFVYITGTATISGLTFENMPGTNVDGGINLNGVSLTLIRDAFQNNATSSASWGGAAVQAFIGAVNISQCTFSNNSALAGGIGESAGGAIYTGIYNYGAEGALTVFNSIFYQNSAPEGGAIYASASTIVNSTFVDNSAMFLAGGAIDIFGGVASVSNNIFAGNSQPPGYGTLALYSTAITQALYSNNNVFYNNISIGTAFEADCTDCTESGDVEASSNPAGPLALNGGVLQTMMPMPGSGAICEGLVSQLPAGTTTDERGYARLNTIYPGFNSGTPCLDAGAVQSKYAFSITTEPPASLLTGSAMSPAPQFKVTENGALLTTTPVPVSVTDTSDALASTPATANSSETLYARLYTNYGGTWVHQDYTLTAAAASVLTSPAPGSTLAGASATFTWSTAIGANATGYQLWLGTTGVGSNNLYSSGAVTALSVTRTNLPTTGATIYARLYTNYNSTWVHTDYTYTEAP